MNMRKTTHTFEELTEANSPQDVTFGSLDRWTFRGQEYMGIGPYGMMPLCIEATDPEGRSVTYAVIEDGGGPVKSHGFFNE